MKKILIHVGLPKTGTKSLQSFFWEFRDQLSEAGLYYPVSGCVTPGYAHHNIGWSYSRKPKLKAKFDARVGGEKDLIKEIREVSKKDVLLSSEGLWALARDEPGRFAAFVSDVGAGRKVKLVVTWRNAAEYCESLYLQRAKVVQVKAITKAARKFFEFPAQFEKVIAFLQRTKGAEVFILQYGKDMTDVFLNFLAMHMGVQINRQLEAKRVINTSLSATEKLLATHLSLSKARFDPKTYKRLMNSLGDGTSGEASGGERSIMPEGMQKKLIELSVEGLKRAVKNNSRVTLYPESLPAQFKTRPYLLDETGLFTFPKLRAALDQLEQSAPA
jgi:hypothetical protein